MGTYYRDFASTTVPSDWSGSGSPGVGDGPGSYTTVDGRAVSGVKCWSTTTSGNSVTLSTYGPSSYTIGAGGGTLEFWLRVSSESGYDKVYFYLDGNLQSNISGLSGETGWVKYTYSLTEGVHSSRFYWRYTTDGSVVANLGGFRLTGVTITNVTSAIPADADVTPALPAPLNLSPAGGVDRDPRLSTRFSWQSQFAGAQTQCEISYRKAGTADPLTVVTSSTANTYYDFAANTFTDETAYEWFVRQHDGTTWSQYSTTETFTATSWITAAAVAGTASSDATDPLTEVATYEAQVRTADAVGFGPWSTSATFQVHPAPNTSVYANGAWQLTPRYIRTGGQWVEFWA